MRPTFEHLREEDDPGCIERERLKREAPAMKARLFKLEAALREISALSDVDCDTAPTIAKRALGCIT